VSSFPTVESECLAKFPLTLIRDRAWKLRVFEGRDLGFAGTSSPASDLLTCNWENRSSSEDAKYSVSLDEKCKVKIFELY
jgi:hypothetical protein